MITKADWWEITKACYQFGHVLSLTSFVYSNITGEYAISVGDPESVKNWLEEMEYRYGDQSDFFEE